MKVALAGIAHWHSAMHAQAIRRAGAEIAGIWDADLALAQEFVDREGGRLCADLSSLVAARPDAVLVMGTPLEMPDRLLAIARAGLPCIVEKPIAPTGAALRPISDMIQAMGAWVAVALPQRVGPLHAALAKLREVGRAGPISHAQFRIINGPPERYRRDHVDWVLDPAVGGGGALRNLGIHGVDSFLAMVEGESVAIASVVFGRAVHDAAVEDYALLTLRAASGALGHIEAGYTYASMKPGGDFEWRISCRNAYLIDRGAVASMVTLDDGAISHLPKTADSGRYDDFMVETLRRLAMGEKPLASIADCQRAMDLIDQAYKWRDGN